MAIVIRKPGGKWEKTEKIIFADEAQLQRLLYESPELIPTKVDDQAVVFTKEAGLPGSGFTDLIGVDAQGNILIVETKLARNGEIRRKVIGQVLEYAAYLWGMSFEELDRFFSKREGKSLLELLGEKSAEVDKDQLKENIEQNLVSGAFQLIIAVDAINPELEKIIAYVSSRGTGLQLEALELELHKQGQLEILVPRRYGQLNQPKESQPGKRVLTFREIIENSPDDHSRNLLALLGELWEAAGNYVKPGTVGASFQARIGTRSWWIFWAYPDLLQMASGDISKRGAPADALRKYRETIGRLPGFNREEILTKSQPITKFSKLTEVTLRTFVAESQELVQAWRESLERVANEVSP